MGEQQNQQTTTTVQATQTSVCPHPEAMGKRWGDPISEERQAELQGYLDRWEAETDHGERRGPFDRKDERINLTGADVFWLANRLKDDKTYAFWSTDGSRYDKAHAPSNLHLEGASLSEAHLEGAILINAHLEGANLGRSHLEAANLMRSLLQGTSLRGVWFNSATDLHFAALDNQTMLGDIHWNGVGSVDLTNIDWAHVTRLGDERSIDRNLFFMIESRAYGDSSLTDSEITDRDILETARALRVASRKAPRRGRQLQEATISYRQVATQLRAQGMTEVADRFTYRAQVLQRRVYLHRFRILQYLGSLFLYIISGYGYRPIRSFITYILVILAFAAAYFSLGGSNGQPLSWNEAIVVSMTAFHGRGFFAAVFQPGDLQAAIAAVEAFIGLLIEIVLIATFTQRFFAR